MEEGIALEVTVREKVYHQLDAEEACYQGKEIW